MDLETTKQVEGLQIQLLIATTTRTVIIQRERELRTFDGYNERCEEWIEEAKLCLDIQHLVGKDAALYLTGALCGHARRELKCHPETVKNGANAIFGVLRFMYGVHDSDNDILRQFVTRVQGRREFLEDFSHALVGIMDTFNKPRDARDSMLIEQ